MLTALDPHTALLLIDLQTGIINTQLAHAAAEVVQQGAALARAFRQVQLPVILVTVDPIGAPWTLTRADVNDLPQDAASQAYVRKVLDDTNFYVLDATLDVQPTDVLLVKTAWNAFHATALDDLLRLRGVTGIVLGGIATTIGVESTARAASERGYNLTFATDAMSDTVLEAHQNSIQHIFPRLGEVTDTAAILAQIGLRLVD